MDHWLLDQARKDAKAADVTRLVEFRAGDALKADLSKATVITLYMLPWFNEAMKPSFEKQLKPGGYKHQHTLYLWKMSKDRN